MGKSSVRLLIDADRLRAAMGSRDTWSSVAERYGVSKQAVNAWLSEGKIPPRALIEIANDLDLDAKSVEEILAPQTLKNREKKKWTITVTLKES